MAEDGLDDAFLARFLRGPDDPRPEWAFRGQDILREMDEVPLFMTAVPENVSEVPALAALQSLLYEGSPEEAAAACKERGNEAYRRGAAGYDDALRCYGEGLAQGCSDPGLNAVLHLNCAAVHLARGSHAQALRDCESALGLCAEDARLRDKARLRAARACAHLERFADALAHLATVSGEEAEGLAAEVRRQQAVHARLDAQRQARRKLDARIDRVLGARGARRVPGCAAEQAVCALLGPACDPSGLPCLGLAGGSAGRLVWPVLLLYPPYGQSDMLEAADETVPLLEHLRTVFDGTPPDWDTQSLYRGPAGLRVFYQAPETNRIWELPVRATRIVDLVGRLVTEVDRGLLALHVLPEAAVPAFLARFPEAPAAFQP